MSWAATGDEQLGRGRLTRTDWHAVDVCVGQVSPMPSAIAVATPAVLPNKLSYNTITRTISTLP